MKLPEIIMEISRDSDNFLRDLTNHINERGQENFKEFWMPKSKKWIGRQAIYSTFLSKVEPGDVLEYWQSDEGFGRQKEGYFLMRKHFEIARITV